MDQSQTVQKATSPDRKVEYCFASTVLSVMGSAMFADIVNLPLFNEPRGIFLSAMLFSV
jgi:hypothetical protein